MKEYIDLGPTPACEDCLPAGHDGCRAECQRYLELCRKVFTQADEFGVRFVVKSNPHDFGSYYEVNAVCNGNDDRALAYAYWCQENQPEKWTDETPLVYVPEPDYDGVRPHNYRLLADMESR